MRRIEYATAVKRYGEIDLEKRKWADEGKWMMSLTIPAVIADGWRNSLTGQDTTRIYCNRDMAPALLLALEHVLDRGHLSELHTFDGCFCIRKVRGPSGKVSTHSYGLAIDVNALENPQYGPVKMTSGFVKCWTDAGFDWGGNFENVDGMHFSYAWEGRP